MAERARLAAKITAFVATALVTLAVFVPPASATTLGSTFQVNTYGSDDQWRSAVASDSDGDFVAAWQSTGQDGSDGGIYAQRFSAAGSKQGGEFRVNTHTAGLQTEPAVAMDSDGDFVITWVSAGQDGSSLGVYAQRYNATGVPQGSEFRVNTYVSGDQSGPAVAMDSDGDFVVTWYSSQDSSGYGIFGQRFAADGTAQGLEFPVNTTTAGWQLYPSVAMDADGDFVVTWQSETDAGFDIAARRFSAAGVAADSSDVWVSTAAGTQEQPSVAMDADGDFVVAWASRPPSGFYAEVVAQRFNATGVAQGAELRTYADVFLWSTAVAMDADGDFVVAWNSGGARLQRYAPDGTKQGSDYSFNASTGFVGTPSVAVDSVGNAVMTWSKLGSVFDNFSDFDRYVVLGQRIQSGAHEVCDDADNDRDGEIDEGFTKPTVYRDADWDTYGNPDVSKEACSAGSGYVIDNTDCNDQNYWVNPGATEVANNLDDDCNGTADDNLATPWYRDADRDGYGDVGDAVSASTQPSGYVADDTDCDDSADTVYPGARETADDGIDQNCNDVDLVTYFRDADNDTYGDALTSQTSETGAPDGYVSNATDADDGDGTVYPNAPELCDGKNNDQDGQTDEGWPDTDGDNVANCIDPDDDGDNLADTLDPDVAAEVVADLPDSSFGNRGSRAAFLTRLNEIEVLIAADNTKTAIDELQSLVLRVDGCTGGARERADRNDWISNCVDQHEVRDLLTDLIAALRNG